MCYQVNEWIQRYEVSIKGREPKNGEELRAGPLSYVRLKVYGHRQGAGYRRLQLVAGNRLMEVFGIFCKLLEISGNQTRERRGKLLNEKDEPATIDDIAFILGISAEQVKFAIDKLCEVGWIISPNPEISGKSGTLLELNSTKLNSTQLKEPAKTETSGNFRKETKSHTSTSADRIISAWQKLPLPPEKKSIGGADLTAIDRIVSELDSDTQEPVHEGMILEAIENYSKALALPNSQAFKHKLYPWLKNHVRKYVSYAFDIDHHDGSKFKKAGPNESAYDQVAQLKARGDL